MLKKIKVRTSITIDPDLLDYAKKHSEKSVSQFIERAIEYYRDYGPIGYTSPSEEVE